MTFFPSRSLSRVGLLAVAAMLVITSVFATQSNSTADSRAAATRTARGSKPKPAVVLVHGAWADSSSWTKVTKGLQAHGYQVLAPSIPLRGLREDSKYLSAFLRDRTTGPVVLVGHSYGGAVITNAANADKDVKALVYVDAFVPDQGDSILGLLDPNHLLGAPKGDFDLYLKQAVFPGAIANGIPAGTAVVMAAAQRPVTFSALTAPSGSPAWRSVPSFYLLGTDDRIIPLALQRSMAVHAGAQITEVASGHLPMITDARAVESLVVRAGRST